MNAQMMEGLTGASINIHLSDTSMRIYRQANAEGDTEKMNRALTYAGTCTEQAVKYQEKLDKGIKTEAKEEREKTKLEQEAAIEKRREEQKKAENRTQPVRTEETDTIQITNAAKAAMQDNPAITQTQINSDPVTYTETGEIVDTAEIRSAISLSA